MLSCCDRYGCILLCGCCGEESKSRHQHQKPGRKKELSHWERPNGWLEYAYRVPHGPRLHVCDGLRHLRGWGTYPAHKCTFSVHMLRLMNVCLHQQEWQISSTQAVCQERPHPVTHPRCASCVREMVQVCTSVRWATTSCTTATKEHSGN